MKKLIIGVLLFGFTTSANAIFTDNTTYLSDSVSGLDWLDVTATQGLSFNTVSAEFGVGGLYEGWRYATSLEFDNLVTNWTGTTSSGNLYAYRYFSEASDTIDNLIATLGNTNTANTSNDPSLTNYSYGLTADAATGGKATLAILTDYDERTQQLQDYANARYFSALPDEAKPNFGPFLVRQTSVPEGTSIILFTIGLLGLFGVARRKT